MREIEKRLFFRIFMWIGLGIFFYVRISEVVSYTCFGNVIGQLIFLISFKKISCFLYRNKVDKVTPWLYGVFALLMILLCLVLQWQGGYIRIKLLMLVIGHIIAIFDFIPMVYSMKLVAQNEKVEALRKMMSEPRFCSVEVNDGIAH